MGMTDQAATAPRLRLRVAESEADLDAILELGRLSHAEGRYAHLPFGKVRMRAMGLAAMKDTERNLLLLAEQDGEPVGCVVASAMPFLFTDATFCAATLFFVKPEARASRIALHLLGAYAQWAKTRGAVEATIHVTSGRRMAAVGRFLTRKGFRLAGGNYYLPLKQG